MCVHLMSACGLEKQQRNKDWEVFEHERLQVEGGDSSFDMQNGLAENLLAGSHKPVLEATPLLLYSPPPPPPIPPPTPASPFCGQSSLQ